MGTASSQGWSKVRIGDKIQETLKGAAVPADWASVRCQDLCCQALPLPLGLGCLFIALDLKLLEFVGNRFLVLCPLRFVTEDKFIYVALIQIALSPCTYSVICYQPF